ncbi:HemK methyltransferase family member 2, partial [Tetrabaena socialis]
RQLFNPPYVPTPDEEVERGGIASAWAGGFAGRRVIDRVLPLLPELLSPVGELFMVTVAENDPEGIIADMRQHGFLGCVAGSRQADEETLSIVHLWRDPAQQQ